MSGFDLAVDRLIEHSLTNLQSIDISFNELTKIDESITQFPNIRSLYIHGNQIGNFHEVQKLIKMSNLRRLTLHGNPIGMTRWTQIKKINKISENLPNYRPAVLLIIPQLKNFDFSGVTKNDRFVSVKLGPQFRKKKPSN